MSNKSYPASIRDYFTNTKLEILACSFVMDEHRKTLYEYQHYIVWRTQGMETDLDLNTPPTVIITQDNSVLSNTPTSYYCDLLTYSFPPYPWSTPVILISILQTCQTCSHLRTVVLFLLPEIFLFPNPHE